MMGTRRGAARREPRWIGQLGPPGSAHAHLDAKFKCARGRIAALVLVSRCRVSVPCGTCACSLVNAVFYFHFFCRTPGTSSRVLSRRARGHVIERSVCPS